MYLWYFWTMRYSTRQIVDFCLPILGACLVFYAFWNPWYQYALNYPIGEGVGEWVNWSDAKVRHANVATDSRVDEATRNLSFSDPAWGRTGDSTGLSVEPGEMDVRPTNPSDPGGHPGTTRPYGTRGVPSTAPGSTGITVHVRPPRPPRDSADQH